MELFGRIKKLHDFLLVICMSINEQKLFRQCSFRGRSRIFQREVTFVKGVNYSLSDQQNM